MEPGEGGSHSHMNFNLLSPMGTSHQTAAISLCPPRKGKQIWPVVYIRKGNKMLLHPLLASSIPKSHNARQRKGSFINRPVLGARSSSSPSWPRAIFRPQSPVCVLLPALLDRRTSSYFFLPIAWHIDTSSCTVIVGGNSLCPLHAAQDKTTQ
jgi:hypothetical protein